MIFVFQDDLLQSLNKSEEVTDKPEDEIKDLSPKSSDRSESEESSKPSESMTDYFQQCSSKLGHSLSSSNSGGSRPNFGFGNLNYTTYNICIPDFNQYQMITANYITYLHISFYRQFR